MIILFKFFQKKEDSQIKSNYIPLKVNELESLCLKK